MPIATRNSGKLNLLFCVKCSAGKAGKLEHTHAGYAVVLEKELAGLFCLGLSVCKKGELRLHADALE